MDSLLVMNESGFHERLEGWLLRAIPFILSPSGFSTAQARTKAMAEVALTVVVLSDWRSPETEWSRLALDLIAERYADPEVRGFLEAVPACAVGHVWITQALRTHRPESENAGTADIALALGTWSRLATEAGYRLSRLETSYLTYRLGRKMQGSCDGQLVDGFGGDWFQNRPPASYQEIYELVHAIFFLTDFGSNRWTAGRNEAGSRRSILDRFLRRGLEISLQRRQLDLVGEITLARLCLDPATEVDDTLETLAEAQQQDGEIRGWLGTRSAQNIYHATLIALLAVSRRDICRA
jgi:hypothetical protein